MFQTKQLSEALAQVTALTGQVASIKAAVEADGFFALTAGEGGKFTVSLTDAGRQHFAAEVVDLTAKLGDATASADALAREKLDLEGKLSGAPAAERQRIGAAVDSAGLFSLAFDGEGKPAVALTEKGEAQFVNDKANRVLAAAGHQALPVGVDSPAPGNTASAPSGKGRTKTTWAK